MYSIEDLKQEYTFIKDTNFQINEGWIELIYKVCKQIQALINNYNEKFEIRITQIKQRFGTLRIRYTLNSDISKELKLIINSIIQKAENDSNNICEKCGEFGKLRNDSFWIHTYCDECEKSFNPKINKK